MPSRSRFFALFEFIVVFGSSLLFGSGLVMAAERVPSSAALSLPDAASAIREYDVKCYRDLKTLANRYAQQEYVSPPPLIATLADLNYEQYREIQFRHQEAIWSDGKHPFWLEFFHRGFVQRDRVDVFLVESTGHDDADTETSDCDAANASRAVKQVLYRPEQFHFGAPVADLRVPDDVGFAGLKVAGRFQPGGDPQELLTFIGSSYFRSRSADTVYGTSARGLAIDIGMNRDEEFPDFTKFWVLQPDREDESVIVLALLDGPSLSGAYQFEFDPGTAVSRVDVQATLYFRKHPEKLAIAPLTSMWTWGDGLNGPPLDERPAVHDCDGLLVHADDEWSWRALARLPYPSVTSTPVKELIGFGLLQRNRRFDHYRDSNARYHERPSVWVQPNKPFGAGQIELVEIPGAHEGIDNIGAYFVSDAGTGIDEPLSLDYSVHFFGGRDAMQDLVSPRDGNECGVWGAPLATCDGLHVFRDEERITVTVEFVADARSHSTAEKVDAIVKLVRGELLSQNVIPTPQGYLVNLCMRPTEPAPIEIEFALENPTGERRSETFRYLCPHEQPTFVYPAVYTRQE